MLPLLLPIVTAIVPEMAKWLFPSNPKAGTAIAAVTDVVQSVTGGDATTAAGVAAIGATLAGKPDLAIQLQQKLAELHASMQAEADQAQQATLAAQLADIANARQQTVALAQAHSAVQWAAPIVSFVVLATFGAVMALALTRTLPAGSETILNMLLGTLASMAVSVVSYWVGSSAGSQRKDGTIANAAAALAVSSPPTN